MRYVALVQPTDIHPGTRHSIGLPAGLAEGDFSGEEMPWPRVLLLSPSGRGIALDRFTESGETAGDTWHENLEDARHQAIEEYNGSLGAWREVPSDIPDEQVVAFAMREVDS